MQRDQEKEIREVLEGEVDPLAFEGIADEQSSPLNQAVKEKDVAGAKTEPQPEQQAEGEPTAQAEPQEEAPQDAPEQTIDDSYQFGKEEEKIDIPDDYAGSVADFLLGSANNFIEVGGGFFVRIRKHEDFYDFDEVVQVIDEQNERNIKLIKLDEEDKALLRPLLIQVIKNRAKILTPEQQLLGALLSIIVKKANVVMQIRAENEILTERILQIIREGREYAPGQEEPKTAGENETGFDPVEEPEAAFEESVLEVADEVGADA